MSRYIDADRMKNGIMQYADVYGHISCGVTSFNILVEQLTKDTADVQEVKHGRWIEKPFEFRCWGITTYSSVTDTVCSVCGESAIEYAESPYCPWCGAKMDEVEE